MNNTTLEDEVTQSAAPSYYDRVSISKCVEHVNAELPRFAIVPILILPHDLECFLQRFLRFSLFYPTNIEHKNKSATTDNTTANKDQESECQTDRANNSTQPINSLQQQK